jgi:hypothetical protein
MNNINEFKELTNNMNIIQKNIQLLDDKHTKLSNKRKDIVKDFYSISFEVTAAQSSKQIQKFNNVVLEIIRNNEFGDTCFYFNSRYYTNSILDVLIKFKHIPDCYVTFLNCADYKPIMTIGVFSDCSKINFWHQKYSYSPKEIPMQLFNKLCADKDRDKIFNLILNGEFDLGITLLTNLK